ncbi:hypothetical protein ACJIZ3_003561 [Penstemon smallii]|uniref:SWIM-type domain-containing protein n=1 Tax=Penstemon smallii TaxID=265156 RepID=A0ABD3UCA5_9LAMI
MEQGDHLSAEAIDLQCPDLNYGNENEETNHEIEFASLSIEEMESRFEVGFSVRKDNCLQFTDGSGVRARGFVCSCEGKKDNKRSRLNVPVCVKPTFRCECKAKLRVARLKGQNWRVTGYMLRSARHISSEKEKCLEAMVKCRIPLARVYEFFETISNGRENVGFTRKDAYDCVYRAKKQSRIENGDVAQLIEHFMSLSNKEPYFYWKIERDENNRLVNLFFRDYRCSVDYEYFSDVLSVDTTYKTNKYGLICCPFVGINNHLQNIFFGFAFMSDEKEKSFEWLFRTFLDSMGGRQPEVIFTDQCLAMMNAIRAVFPYSHHRLCHWHINQNSPKYFGSLNTNWSFKSLWHECMTECESEEEFELTWKHMENDYNIGNINWFSIMYDLRLKWATCFSSHRFSADLNATSRSEGTNAALKKKFGGTISSLYDCVLAFEKLQESWHLNEKEMDTRSHFGRLPVGQNTWLIQASQVYTLEIFAKFQQEMRDLVDFAIIDQQEISGTSSMLFTLKSRGQQSKFITVRFDSQTTSLECSCRMFETSGILCSHALRILDRGNVDYIPERYIIKRWTRNVANRVCGGLSGRSSNASDMAFVHEIMRRTYDLASRAQSYKETKCIIREFFESAESKVNDWFEHHNMNDLGTTNDLGANEDNPQTGEILLRNPLLAKSRGITDVRARFWDVKGKKTRGRGETSSEFEIN